MIVIVITENQIIDLLLDRIKTKFGSNQAQYYIIIYIVNTIIIILILIYQNSIITRTIIQYSSRYNLILCYEQSRYPYVLYFTSRRANIKVLLT